MTDIEFSSEITTKLVRHMMADEFVVQAAQVSSKGETEVEELVKKYEEGKINIERFVNALVKGKHGCYDKHTEVLTDRGWKLFSELTGEESFLTKDIESNRISYQKAERVIAEHYSGEMIRIKTQQVDLLVTPEHRMLGESRTHVGWGSHVKTFPAYELEQRSHRLFLGGGLREGEVFDSVFAELLGFIIADGNVHKNKISFHLKKSRKVDWLKARAKIDEEQDDWYVLDTTGFGSYFLELAKATYNDDRDRVIPRDILENWSGESIGHLIDGYLEGDGSVGDHGQISMSTVSAQLADDLQEAAALAGGSISYRRVETDRYSSFGNRPVHHLGLISSRNSRPRIGWTVEDRAREVYRVDYDDKVYCVTVPSGILYVRRNGKSLWCGNSPFEHNAITLFVEAPIFVFREWHRHRIASINEMSGRYTELPGKFYIPANDRVVVNNGTKMKPSFDDNSPGAIRRNVWTQTLLKEGAEDSWARYQDMLRQDVAPEVARMVLPVNIYSQMYWTVNARSLMNFLSLRSRQDGAAYVSYPQREIQMGAEQIEDIFAELMPHTYNAFIANGRVAP